MYAHGRKCFLCLQFLRFDHFRPIGALLSLAFRRVRVLAVSSIVLAASATVPPAGAATAAVPGLSESPAASARTITLITGDKVKVTTGPDGGVTSTLLSPDGQRPVDAVTHTEDGERYVFPRSTLKYLAAGLLDRNLF